MINENNIIIKPEFDFDDVLNKKDLLGTTVVYQFDEDLEYNYFYVINFIVGSAILSYFNKPRVLSWELKIKK